MKIALPSRQNMIDDHFGHCEAFTIFTIDENKEIVSKEMLPSPAGCGCKSNIAQTLSEMDVSLMLAGNMGEGAVRVLDFSGIEVIRGCSGDVNDVVAKWLSGTLTDSGVGCDAHGEGHSCHE